MGKNSLIKSTSKKTQKVTKKTTTEAVKNEKVDAAPPLEPSAKPVAVEKPKKKVATKPKKQASQTAPKEKPKAVPTPPAPVAQPSPPPEPPVTVTYDTPSGPSQDDPMDKTLLILAGCILFLFVLIIGASASNSSRYHIKKLPLGIEIQQGKFAPLGEKKLIVLPDMNAPAEEKEVYRRDDVFPLIFKHYLNKADALLAAPGMPDYENIRQYLAKAQNFAVTNELSQAVSKRLTAIDLNNLLYRANVGQDQDTQEGLERALQYLSQAEQMDLVPEQKEQITRQRDNIRERLRELKEIEAAMELMPEEAAAPSH